MVWGNFTFVKEQQPVVHVKVFHNYGSNEV